VLRERRSRSIVPAIALLAIGLGFPPAAMAEDEGAGAKLRCTIKGTKGSDELNGTAGDDVICAKQGDDTIFALGGDDYVFAEGGNDRVGGGPGEDHLLGGLGNDLLNGGPEDDGLYGEKGNDRLRGRGGADALYGHFGSDRHAGGPGLDHVSGGPGADVGEPKGAQPRSECPSTAPVCEFHMHLDVSAYCPSYSKGMSTPACIGGTPYAPPGWFVYPMDLPGLFGTFGWFDGCCYRGGIYYKETEYIATVFLPVARLQGKVPYAASAEYTIEDAYVLTWDNPGIHFYTPDLPGVPPGSEGGPLYLNFVNGIIGADMYIDGFLYRR
jgi:hemolysin type calcium-binding protein